MAYLVLAHPSRISQPTTSRRWDLEEPARGGVLKEVVERLQPQVYAPGDRDGLWDAGGHDGGGSVGRQLRELSALGEEHELCLGGEVSVEEDPPLFAFPNRTLGSS